LGAGSGPIPAGPEFVGPYNMESEPELLTLLDNIRINCVLYANAHRERFFVLHASLKYYKIPVLVLSSFSSAISLSQEYIQQRTITITNTILGLVCSIIVSVELYLGISREMSSSESVSKKFHALATEISKQITLYRVHPSTDILPYIEASYTEYSSLVTNSSIIRETVQDQLMKLPEPPLSQNDQGGTATTIIRRLSTISGIQAFRRSSKYTPEAPATPSPTPSSSPSPPPTPNTLLNLGPLRAGAEKSPSHDDQEVDPTMFEFP
jgi:hypothetical protein